MRVMKLDNKTFDFLYARLDDSRIYNDGIMSRCPYHDEKTGSFFIYFDYKHKYMWWFKCQGCGKTGSLNTLLKKMKGYEFITPEAPYKPSETREKVVWKLDDTKGYPINYVPFLARGISVEIVDKFGFRFDYHDVALILPVYTRKKYMGYIRRNLDPLLPKYMIEKGMNISESIWGYDNVDKNRTTYLTEGIIDAATLWSSGKQAISLCGKESWVSKVPTLRQIRDLIFIPDNDKSGLSTARDIAQATGARLYFVPAGFKDISEWYTSEEYRKLLATT